ncbi:LOW QUALITY PROTEIN: hypothetical protein OSB04_007874 [Centaurea solstitialis]|uniref:ATP-dependent DNA helicase n=1 Tax=Centaurea solstitialis TaxID=347529 RepID=A0AA38WSU1_9ASTR|nr:LOW QUALITY PROTEIN: hypothetical protein OSB04_007874 [Centaurea solstitialis]
MENNTNVLTESPYPASFIRGPCDMRRRYMDAMALVQDDGKPNIFLTMTCNPNWSEILQELLPDRPDLVARVFRAKLEDLNNQLLNKHILGKVGAYVYVIEFQKRGLPHAHFLMIMKLEYKITNADHYDKFVSAEIPDPTKYPEMYQLVIKHMMHVIYDRPALVWKYVYKGHDKQVIHVDPGREDVHLPNKQLVRFRENDILTDIVDRERDKRSMLTAFFERNKTDFRARQYLYKDFPNHYTWNASSRIWNPRRHGSMRGRLVSANPARGERYYLRLLLSHISGPTCFEDLYTVNGVLHPTFRKAALERGLIETDDNVSHCLAEASVFQFPSALRRLFATILIYCEPGYVRKLWDEHYDSLSEDHTRHHGNVEVARDMVLKDIALFLQSMGKNLNDFDLPSLNVATTLESRGFREVQEEHSIIVEDEHLRARNSLNADQMHAFDEIMRHVDNDWPGVFFVDGPGGTGKRFMYKALLANVRSLGLIALVAASSGVAANNMPGGRTTHSRFNIPLNLSNNSMCNIKKQSGTAQLLQAAKIIIWDEASVAKRQAVEAFDRTMQDITGVRLPFGGNIMIMGGDFRQVLPVTRHGTRAQIVDSSLRMSPIWSSMKKLRLRINMRAFTDPWFSDFLFELAMSLDGNFIHIPDDMEIPYTNENDSKDALIDAIFPSLQTNGTESNYIISRAILTTKNDHADEINDQLIERLCEEEKVYYSFDEAEDDKNSLYPMEYLNSLNVSGLPLTTFGLKSDRNVVDAEIAVGQHVGKRVFLPRIPLCPSEDDMFPFKLKRKQFPIRHCFAMTINKAQGQTIPVVGVYLPDSVFSHGQLYVALSRGISRGTTKVLVKPTKTFKQDGVYTSNVVYREVLSDDCI